MDIKALAKWKNSVLFLLVLFIFSITVGVMATNPTMTINSPANDSNYTVNYTVSNITSDVNALWCNVTLDDATNYSMQNVSDQLEWNYTITGLSEGIHNLTYMCQNASDINQTGYSYFRTDFTYPTIQYESDTITSGNRSTNWVLINVTASDTYLDDIIIKAHNGSYLLNQTNSSDTSPFFWNITGLTDGNWFFNVTANDTANNANSTATLNITIDITSPVVLSTTNTNYTATNNASIFVEASDATTGVRNCSAIIYGQAGNTTITGTMAGTENCTVNIHADNVTGIGWFHVNTTIEDFAGNNNYSDSLNWTKVTLYEGWNIIQAMWNGTLLDYGALNDNITHVSWYNHTSGALSFVNYVKGVAANNQTAVVDGDALYFYVNGTTPMLMNWAVNVLNRNYTVYSGWNLLTHYNTTTAVTFARLEVLALTNATDDQQSILYTSFYNSSLGDSGAYRTHRVGFTVYENYTIPRGYGYWMYLNGTAGNWSYFISGRE